MSIGFGKDGLQLDIIQQLFYRARLLDCLRNRNGFYKIYSENSIHIKF